ncbi:cytochrome P450 [Mollisia scopiformis]|uniref:Cytochrome P450 n=1 Tax=Mollisia scopiformis TaxID=149040 RepID=A0A132BAI7_MOLSC|nr:cytochrome P450 [Mollisia scopiformis]KUJ09019.1 cytochrome P450 [Mollisia scopiformis]
MLLSNLGVIVCTLLVVVLWLYRHLLPKPIPGIPYNERSVKRMLGDLPDAFKWRQETGEMWSYIRNQALELNSPIFQMFMRSPIGKPEFDRSAFLSDIFGPLLPGNHVWMPSNDEFRSHRNLIKDTMSPPFLRNVVAPAIHSAIEDLLELWQQKLRLAQGRPFQADHDLIRGVVDVIMLATLGVQTGLSKSQSELLSETEKLDLSTDINVPPVFPAATESRAYTAIRTLVDSIQIGMTSPAPRMHMNFALKFYPSLAAARKYTDQMMTGVLHTAWQKASRSGQDDQVTSAVDLLIRLIRDELFGFYLAGHETTSTTLCWAVKHLIVYQEVQEKLFSALKSVHKRAVEEDRLPTAHEIVDAEVPYLDAFIEENHRLGTAIPTVIRRATRDAVVLGHVIPKGTDVFMIMNGPSFQSPALGIAEDKRSATSRDSKDRYGVWNDENVGKFLPERFLAEDEKGITKFNPFAGPVLPYGVGLRSCFGIKLGILELRVIITMIVWTFVLQKTPPALSSLKGVDVNTHRAQQTYIRLKNR